jgi:aspartyl-tRNA(Asn)/glutamyl-tRNA(Gln) amidotransferase subunit C
MSEQITPEIFSHMVELAALALTPQEAEYLRKQLNNQLASIQELALIPLDETTEIASHGVPYTQEISQPLRTDEWHPDSATNDILAQVPQIDENYIVVPDIPHTELS